MAIPVEKLIIKLLMDWLKFSLGLDNKFIWLKEVPQAINIVVVSFSYLLPNDTFKKLLLFALWRLPIGHVMIANCPFRRLIDLDSFYSVWVENLVQKLHYWLHDIFINVELKYGKVFKKHHYIVNIIIIFMFYAI